AAPALSEEMLHGPAARANASNGFLGDASLFSDEDDGRPPLPASAAEAESGDALHWEVFPASLSVRSLPVVAFSDEADEQLVWFDGFVRDGRVGVSPGPPDVCAKNPVVMSPAFLGFAIEPYEKRYLHYRRVGVLFARPRGGRFMQPSIDTILVCRALADVLDAAHKSKSEVGSIIDVGSGSGFLGKFAAAHAPGSRELEVTLVDLDAEAMRYCQSEGFNASERGRGGRQVAWHLRAEDAVALLEDSPGFDLLISNPPYIPTRGEVENSTVQSSPGGFWEGISLVVFLLELISGQRCPRGARLVMMVTSITLKSPAVLAALAA
ncbi:unnamed protein product, partial [Polarella glacialis]